MSINLDYLDKKDSEVLRYFRHETFRPGQKETILEALEAFKSGKKVVVAELPTGTGKSDIGIVIARVVTSGKKYDYYEHERVVDEIIDYYDSVSEGIKELEMPQAYVVTSQKPLQSQYFEEFGYPEKGATRSKDGVLYDIRGRANYTCTNPKNAFETDCSSNKRSCPLAGTPDCAYTYERIKAQAHPIASTNSAFYAVGTGNWLKRRVTIIDECHNTPDDVLGLVSVIISDDLLNECNLVDSLYDESLTYKDGKKEEVPVEKFFAWVQKLIMPITKHIEVIKDSDLMDEEDEKLLEKLEDLLRRMTNFLDTREGVEWVTEVEHRNGSRHFVARPLDSGYFAPGMFLNQSDLVFMQSATIIDPVKFAQDMGIDPQDMAFIQKPSPFPYNRRPIFNVGIAKMGRKDQANSLDVLCDYIQKVMDHYPKQKGIIHCHTYRLQKEILDRLADTERIIAPNSHQRERALKEHTSSSQPTVLMSPSMTEGVDLKDDLCRFSLICKIPYPFLGDKRIKLKCDADPAWFRYQTAKTLVQAVGRGMRSEDDWCHTYILDQGFSYFSTNAPLPPDFRSCLQSRAVGEATMKKVKEKYTD